MEMKALRAMLEERRSSSLARQNKSARPELRRAFRLAVDCTSRKSI